jgi:L-lactate utilization protein LutB
MQGPVDTYWSKRLEAVAKALEENNFQVFSVQSAEEAGELVIRELLPAAAPKTVSWGGSMSVEATGLKKALREIPGLAAIDPYEPGLKPEEAYEKRRQGLLADLYLAGTNALTEDGQLVNLDATGNRVGAINFGPRNVVLVIGRNKLVPDLAAAFTRIKEYAAPVNAIRLDRQTPCCATSVCADCKSAGRICNVWSITEKSFPKHRIKVILVNQDLGF